jgi:hypothetical protein
MLYIRKYITVRLLTEVVVCLFFAIMTNPIFALEEAITVPAESSEGVVLDLGEGNYTVIYQGGAAALSFPINPNYCWSIGVAVGSDVEGGQDAPNLGTLYFEPRPVVSSQAEAEKLALEATEDGYAGTNITFSLSEDSKVRFWVSDFDYTDNSGMIKLRVISS